MKTYETRCSACSSTSRLRIAACTETSRARRRLVADDDLRLAGEGARDCDALLEAARELNRLLRQRPLGDAHASTKGRCSRASAISPRIPASLRIERRRMRRTEWRRLRAESGFWKTICSDAKIVPRALLVPRRELSALERRDACRRRHDAEQRPGQRGLAAARLADEPERLARPHRLRSRRRARGRRGRAA